MYVDYRWATEKEEKQQAGVRAKNDWAKMREQAPKTEKPKIKSDKSKTLRKKTKWKVEHTPQNGTRKQTKHNKKGAARVMKCN